MSIDRGNFMFGSQAMSLLEFVSLLCQGVPNCIFRMVISHLVTDREIQTIAVNPEKWCSCIDGALTKEKYLESIRKAGFDNVKVFEEKLYLDGDQVSDGRKNTSLVIRALKG
jgi:arsenite methyltransferase